MEYFDILIDGSTAVYEEVRADGTIAFLDAAGNAVEPPQKPIHYILRSFCIARPEWMEPLHQEP